MSRRSTRIAEQAMRNAFEHVLEAQRLTEARISAMSEQIAALWGEDNDDESEPDAQANEANKEPALEDLTGAEMQDANLGVAGTGLNNNINAGNASAGAAGAAAGAGTGGSPSGGLPNRTDPRSTIRALQRMPGIVFGSMPPSPLGPLPQPPPQLPPLSFGAHSGGQECGQISLKRLRRAPRAQRPIRALGDGKDRAFHGPLQVTAGWTSKLIFSPSCQRAGSTNSRDLRSSTIVDLAKPS